MSALARFFKAQGSIISGSDKETSYLINDLKNEGINDIWIPHNIENLKKTNPDYVIYSTAVIANNNEELNWAKENKKTILHRADLLDLATKDKKLISVSGTHGKTTTTAMISEILINSRLDPSVILGGILIPKNTNAIYGNGDYFVIEADESDKSFLKGEPEISVITNIESDHLENYTGGFEEIKRSFLGFAKKAMQKKGLIVCFEDKNTKEVISNNFNINDSKLITYGIHGDNDVVKVKTYAKYNMNTRLWDIFTSGKYITSFKLKQPGEHNVLNALAAFCVGHLLELDIEQIKQTLENYQGVKRRFQILGEVNNITVIDDYAHHPTEISATIKSAKELNPKRLIIVLQPHQPTRLRDLWNEFIEVLEKVEDLVFITDTYIARGSAIEGISSKKLVEEIGKQNINYLEGNINEYVKYLEKLAKPGDLIIIMGAGNITDLGPMLIKHLIQIPGTINI